MSGNGRGNTLGGGPASDPPPSTWGRPTAPRIGRIGDWSGTSSSRPAPSNAGPPRPPIVHDDDDDDDEGGPPPEGESWFAGGERRYAHTILSHSADVDLWISGISVQNPNARDNVPGGRMVQDILRRAAECVVLVW